MQLQIKGWRISVVFPEGQHQVCLSLDNGFYPNWRQRLSGQKPIAPTLFLSAIADSYDELWAHAAHATALASLDLDLALEQYKYGSGSRLWLYSPERSIIARASKAS